MTLTVGGATYTTAATNSGAWSLDLGAAIPTSGTLALDANGANAVTATATATDRAGNVSTIPATQTLTLDTTAPNAPTLALAVDAGASASDGLTNNDLVNISGIEAGARVQISPSGGGFWYTATGTSLDLASEGAKVVLARQTDAAGNVSATTELRFTVDRTAPVIASVSIPDAPLRIGDTATATITVALDTDSYTLEAGATIAGFALDNLTKVDATTYTATFTVTEGADVAAGTDLPVDLVLVDRAGNASAAHTTAIAQGADAIDATRPAFGSAMVDGATLTLTYTETLDAANLPAASAFAVLAGGQPVMVAGVAASGSTVTLTLAAPVASGQAVTVAYADPTPSDDAAAIQDLAGNDAATLAVTSVTNTTRPPPPPPVDPNPTPPVVTIGDAGNDLLRGGPGDERIDGGGGTDVLRVDANRDAVTLVRNADGSLTLSGPGLGTDEVRNVEVLRFDDRVELVPTALDPIRAALRSFDETSYLQDNPDVAAAVANGQFPSARAHYDAFGQADGRLPGMSVNEAFYLAQNADVADAVARGDFASGHKHYEWFGQAEGRDPSPLFDESWYFDTYADVGAAVRAGTIASGYDHFRDFGWREGRDPSAWMDTDAYLTANPDVAAAGVDPLDHYLVFGARERRVIQVNDDGMWMA